MQQIDTQGNSIIPESLSFDGDCVRPYGPPLSKNAVINNIILFRTNKGLTKRAMAEKMGINEVSYARIESCEIGLSYEHICKIASIFEISVINLIAYPRKYVEEAPYLKKIKKLELDVEYHKEFVRNELKELTVNLTQTGQSPDALIKETEQLRMQIEYLQEAVKDKDTIIHLMTKQNNR